jgi:hypothetical protein
MEVSFKKNRMFLEAQSTLTDWRVVTQSKRAVNHTERNTESDQTESELHNSRRVGG